MKIQLIFATAIAMFALAACNSAESPSKVDSDVAAAKQDEKQTVAEAQTDAAKEQGKLDVLAAKNAEELAITKADAAYKVAVQECDALSGDMQKACKDKAEATRDMARADAKAAAAAVKQ